MWPLLFLLSVLFSTEFIMSNGKTVYPYHISFHNLCRFYGINKTFLFDQISLSWSRSVIHLYFPNDVRYVLYVGSINALVWLERKCRDSLLFDVANTIVQCSNDYCRRSGHHVSGIRGTASLGVGTSDALVRRRTTNSGPTASAAP